MADPAFDPWAAAGFAPIAAPTNDNAAKPGTSAVVDVGGPSYSPAIPAGQQGSQLAPSLTSDNGVAGTAPSYAGNTVARLPSSPMDPGDGTTDPAFLRVMKEMNDGGASSPPKAAPATSPAAAPPTSAVPTRAAPPDAFDPWAAAGFAALPPTHSSSTDDLTDGEKAALDEAPDEDFRRELLAYIRAGKTPVELSPQIAAPVAAPEPTPPAAIPPQIAPQELRSQPWYQGLHDTLFSPVGTFAGATQEAQHAFTLGLDEIAAPLIPAITEALTSGKPFTQAYDEQVQRMRQPRAAFEQDHPTAATAISLAAGLPTAELSAPLFAAAPAASTIGKIGNVVRNVGAGTAVGAGTGFTMTDGDINARLAGARQGAEVGGALSTLAPVVAGGAQRVMTAARPFAAIDPIAGNVLRERAGLGPTDAVPTPEAAPIPNLQIGAGGAFNNPGLAAQERITNATDDVGALAQRTANNQAIRDAATTAQPGGVRLATPTTTPDASASVVTALQKAHGILKDEEGRLWTKPELANMTPDLDALHARVRRSIGALPARFQQAIERNPDVRNALADLYALKPGATLADVNQARSGILEASRSLPYSERFAKRAADDAARAVLDGIESNPAMRGNPAALAAYQKARDFTRNMHDALGKPQFQRMLQATEGNHKGLDPGALAGEMFKFARGTERTPQGIAKITGMLDDVRRQWGALATANAGVPLPGLSPASAFAARAELAQGTRDFIIHSMLDSAASNVRDQAGRQNVMMNALSDFIDTNMGWISRAKVFSPEQIDLLKDIRDASVMAQRIANLRGGAGSETFERLKGDRYIDAFMGPFLGRVTGVGTGALAGAVATHLFGEAGIGGMIGMEIGGAVAGHAAGQSLLQRLYAAPRAALMDRLTEAIRDPKIAEDLMKKAGQQVSPQTKQWARSVLAMAPVAEAARTLPAQSETVH